MADQITRGVSTIKWGISDFATISNMYSQSATEKRKRNKVEVKDEKGKTVSVVYYDPTSEVTIKAVYNGYSFPEIGDSVTISPMIKTGGTFLVEEMDAEYGNTNEVRLTLTLKSYDEISGS